jgi:hypothetical protein
MQTVGHYGTALAFLARGFAADVHVEAACGFGKERQNRNAAPARQPCHCLARREGRAVVEVTRFALMLGQRGSARVVRPASRDLVLVARRVRPLRKVLRACRSTTRAEHHG